ncbi:hypothetical protein COCMIDRAFT_35676 [Bipolaris oryzae ATCC 44560]|uniref:Uncharacterized protein n=1 Tax=Bipolaris oryzae ATCC 44560 TaxID=930090 RepID=W6ZSQ6_COCMI|nr:uncharacterized protein COCMIDRAFT_35676 [Bipolaris oryzae ATCC 44560]EUC46681.1 hypothetical protein COCMIDRAFT_35676 [Bipolaris oryzae ATCC 44560]
MLYNPYPCLSSPSPTTMSTPLATPTLLTAEEAAFEMEKAAITSYEQGWDGWDGPVWPVGYVQCSMQMDGYVRPRVAVEGVDDVEA